MKVRKHNIYMRLISFIMSLVLILTSQSIGVFATESETSQIIETQQVEETNTQGDTSGVNEIPEETKEEITEETKEETTKETKEETKETVQESLREETEGLVQAEAVRPEARAGIDLVTKLQVEAAGPTEIYSGDLLTFRVGVDISDGKEALESSELVIYIKEEYVSSIIAKDIDSQVSKSIENVDGFWKVTYKMKKMTGGTSINIPIQIQTKNNTTPDQSKIPVYAKVVGDNGAEKKSNEIEYTTKVVKYKMEKRANGTSVDNREIFIGPENPEKPGFTKMDSMEYVGFDFYITRIPYVSGLGERASESITITDTLPEGAVFDQEKNPSWTYDPETRVVTWVGNNYNSVPSYPGSNLYLRFPDCDTAQKYTNNATVTIKQKDPSPVEEPIVLSDSIDFYLSTKIPGHTFSKFYYGDTLINLPAKINGIQKWTLSYTNNAIVKSPTVDFEIIDKDIDPRLIYSKVEIPKTDASVLDGTLSIYGVKNVGGPRELLASNVSVASAPYELSLDKDILQVIVKADTGTKIQVGKNFRLDIYTDFKDKNDPLAGAKAPSQFRNYATFDGSYEGLGTLPQVKDYHYFTVSEYDPQIITIKRIVSPKNPYLLGDELTYEVTVGTYGTFLEGDKVDFERVVDLLPIGLTYVSGSAKVNVKTGSWTGIDPNLVKNKEPIVIENYHNTGRIGLVWELGSLVPTKDMNYSYDIFSISYKTVIGRDMEEGGNSNDVFVGWDSKNLAKPYSSYSKKDIYDINENGDKEELVGYSTSKLNYAPPLELVTSKTVQGSLDQIALTNPSLGSTEIDGSGTYFLNIKNYSPNTIKNFTVVDTLPHVGDKSVSPNDEGVYAPRNSTFNATLTGPITANYKADQFEVYYTTDSPDKDIESLLSTSTWSKTVADYSKVTAFKIVMISGELVQKEKVSFSVPVKVPNDTSLSAADVAYNSFASSTNGVNFVESNVSGLRVMEYKVEGYVFYDKDKSTQKDVADRIFKDYEVVLLDEKGNVAKDLDGNELRTKTDENGYYSFSVYNAGKYQVKVLTPEGYEVIPYTDPKKGKTGSNLLEATPELTDVFELSIETPIQNRNAGYTKDEEPSVRKTVSRVDATDETDQTLNIVNKKEEFQWNLIYDFGNMQDTWKEVFLEDQLDPILEASAAVLIDVTGIESASDFENGPLVEAELYEDQTEGNHIKVKLLEGADGTFNYLTGKKYALVIVANIKGSTEDKKIQEYIAKGGIENKGTMSVLTKSDKTQVVESNVPKVLPGVSLPEIHKTVNQKESEQLSNIEDTFVWEIKTKFGLTPDDWAQAIISDQVNSILDIEEITITNSKGEDVTANGTLTTEDNKVVFTLLKKEGKFSYLVDETYTMGIKAKIKSTATEKELAAFIKDGGIPNRAQLDIGGTSDLFLSETPKVLPPVTAPEIHKTVNEKEHLNLANKEQTFTWEIATTFGSGSGLWTKAVISDTVNSILTIMEVTVVDGEGTDVTQKGTLTTDNNQVTFTLNEVDGSYIYLAGETYTLKIQSKINETATDAQLAPFIKAGGIENQATFDFGSETGSILSEKPTVLPPTTEPLIQKTVDGKSHLDLDTIDQEFTWDVSATFGSGSGKWDAVSLEDTIDSSLEIVSVSVVDEAGNDVLANGTLTVTDNEVLFALNKKEDSYLYLAGHTYSLQIVTKFIEDITEEQIVTFIKDGGVTNVGTLATDVEGIVTKLDSETKTVTPPVTENEIHKDVEGVDTLTLEELEQVFEWNVTTTFGNGAGLWDSASISDQIDEILEIIEVQILDEDGTDVSETGTLTIDQNHITFDFNQVDDSFMYLANDTYTMVIKTKIKSDVTELELVPYFEGNGIENQADLNVTFLAGRDEEVVVSEIPSVQIPEVLPSLQKTVNGKESIEVTELTENIDWTITAAFGNTAIDWEKAAIKDKINPILDIIEVTVVDENGEDVLSNGNLTKDGNYVIFQMDKKDGSFSYLSGHSYTMVIKTKIKSDLTKEELEKNTTKEEVVNIAEFEKNMDTMKSNHAIAKVPAISETTGGTPPSKDKPQLSAIVPLDKKTGHGAGNNPRHNPKTGDSQRITLYLGFALLSLSAVLGIYKMGESKRRNKGKNKK